MTHPKALEAQQKAEQKKARRQLEKTALNKMKNELGLRFATFGDMTVAYKLNFQVLEVATALRAASDVRDKHTGEVIAAIRFEKGQRIYLKKPKRLPVKKFLFNTLGYFA